MHVSRLDARNPAPRRSSRTYSHAGGKNQRPSGSAVVEFVYAEAAAAAIEALENTELDGRDLRVRQYFSS